MKDITEVKELHEILLDLGKQFHRICTKHSIPYYMLGGTMLGAIRHKGFIPWDDDMDFGVAREDYDRLVGILKNELPEPYGMLTIENSDKILIDIIKISDKRTFVKEIYKENLHGEMGVNIDIFPLDKSTGRNGRTKLIQRIMQIQMYVFLSTSSRPLPKKVIAYVLKGLFCFLDRRSILKFINKYLIENQGDYITNVYGSWGERETMKKEYIGTPKLYQFEDTSFYGVEAPDEYLKSLYGDYMKLPPPEKRHIHITNMFWK